MSTVGGFGRGSNNPKEESVWDYHHLLARLYVFADKYNMPHLQNVAISATIITLAEYHTFPRPNTVNHIDNSTADSQNSPFCRLLNRFFVFSYPNVSVLLRYWANRGDPYCHEFTTDVLCKYSSLFEEGGRILKPAAYWLGIDWCSYHVPEIELKD
ncbi:hypothetical protein BDV97DRAFT_401689 [Delphinella strobiligena]|nr:hypothetical protein BDV97DRAFT_401689 [Delphinella strobiligena]